jgi:threonine/homoserine/homoserine lactone efflux protein
MIEFLTVSALVIVTPGPDTALTVRNTLLGGRQSGVFTALGVVLGQAIWALATAAGLAALLAASEPAFVTLKYLGAAYLVWLGGQALFAAFRGATRAPAGSSVSTIPRRVALRAALRQGLISNLTNPKMAAFFPSLLPQFTGPEAGFGGLLALGGLFCAMTLAWLTGYALILGKAGSVLDRPAVRRALEGMTGAFLVALGLRLATDNR